MSSVTLTFVNFLDRQLSTGGTSRLSEVHIPNGAFLVQPEPHHSHMCLVKTPYIKLGSPLVRIPDNP